jgi:hypothetical protein
MVAAQVRCHHLVSALVFHFPSRGACRMLGRDDSLTFHRTARAGRQSSGQSDGFSAVASEKWMADSHPPRARGGCRKLLKLDDSPADRATDSHLALAGQRLGPSRAGSWVADCHPPRARRARVGWESCVLNLPQGRAKIFAPCGKLRMSRQRFPPVSLVAFQVWNRVHLREGRLSSCAI